MNCAGTHAMQSRRRQRPTRRSLSLTFALIAVWWALASPAGHAQQQPRRHQQQQRQQTGPAKRAAAAQQQMVREVDGAGLTNLLRRDAARPRPLLVNFWATWCEPCREEFPDLIEIDHDYRARGLEVILISLDDVTEIRTNVPEFLRKMRAQAIPAFLLNTPDPDAAITAFDAEWGGQLPATFLFDARGRVVYQHKGRIKPAELRTAIEKTVSAERQR